MKYSYWPQLQAQTLPKCLHSHHYQNEVANVTWRENILKVYTYLYLYQYFTLLKLEQKSESIISAVLVFGSCLNLKSLCTFHACWSRDAIGEALPLFLYVRKYFSLSYQTNNGTRSKILAKSCWLHFTFSQYF